MDTVRSMRILVESVTELRRVLLHPGAGTLARRIRITVADWRPPRPGWSGRLGPLPGLRSHSVRLPRRGRGKARIRIVLDAPVGLREVIAAALPVLWPGPPALCLLPAQEHREPTTDGPEQEGGRTPAADQASADDQANAAHQTNDQAADRLPPGFDLGVINPIGRSAEYGPACPQADLELADGRWRVVSRTGDPSRVLLDWRTRPELDDDAQAVARELNVLHGDSVPVEEPTLVARLIAMFAAMGVVCHWPNLPPTAAELLGPALWQLVSAPLPEPTAGAAAWESLSVAQRRTAMRDHGREFAAGPGGVLRGCPLRRPPVTALLAVTDPSELPVKPDGSWEPGSLPAVLQQVQDQEYDPLELVVAVRGEPPATACAEGLAASTRVPIRFATFPESYTRAQLLTAAANLAQGTLLTVFDTGHDYGVEHVWDLVLAGIYSGADLVGKPAEFTRLEPLDLTVRQSRGPAERYTDRVAGGAVLVARSDLRGDRTGRSRLPLDAGLPQRVLRDGGLVYVTHGLEFLVRRSGSAAHRTAHDTGADDQVSTHRPG